MSVFVDTGVFYAHHDADATRHDVAADAIELGHRIRGVDPYPAGIDLIHTTRSRFDEAVERFEEYADHGLSFTDVTTVVLVEHHDIDAVLSFDDDFDGLVDRLDPSAVERSE